IKHGYDGFQFKRPKIGFEDNQPLETIVENRNRSLSSAKGQTLPTKNYVSAHPSYLRTLGQTHSDWLFGAVAELVDNSRDAKATMLDISVDMIYSSIAGKEIPMLAVVDDGHGMGHDEILKMVSFGRKQPDTNDPDYIGRYGVGFKTGTMRLGRDALVLTQTSNSRSIAFFSQSLNEGKDNIEIPIVSYSRKGQLMDFDTSIQTAASAENNLKSIEEFSPFNKYFIGEKAGLFQRNGTGTQIYVWNLDEWGSEYALEWVNGMSGGSSFHQGDILIRSRRTRSRLGQMTRQVPIDYSLRSYLEVIFLDPRMKIEVQGSLVQLVLGHSQPDLEQGNCGIFLYWHRRLIEAYKRVGSMIHNGEKSHGILGVIDVTGVMDDGNNHVWVHNNKQGFVDCEPYALLEDWLCKKVDEYLDNTIDKHPYNGKCEMPEQKVEPGVITISSRRSGYDTKENSPNQNNQLKSKQEEGSNMTLASVVNALLVYARHVHVFLTYFLCETMGQAIFVDNEENVEEIDDTEENVSDNEEKADEEIEKRKAALIAELKAIEKRAEKQTKVAAETEDNDVNVNENADETDNEDDADQNDDVDEVLTNIETLPFLNTPKRSKKKEDGKTFIIFDTDITKTVKETKDNKKRKFERSGSEEPEKKKTNRQKSTYKGTMKNSGSHKKPIMEESPKRFTREETQKKTKKAESSTSKSYLKNKSKNESEEEENKESEEEEEEVRKLIKIKMEKGAEKEYNESDYEEEPNQVKKAKKRRGSKAEKPYPTCHTRSSPKALYEAMMSYRPRSKCLLGNSAREE
ncbi:MORC family CW-type zinc finger protein 2B-like protein isoform X1, partial [Tanacetum coccineum]